MTTQEKIDAYNYALQDIALLQKMIRVDLSIVNLGKLWDTEGIQGFLDQAKYQPVLENLCNSLTPKVTEHESTN